MGTAGGSAQREYERRLEGHKKKVRKRLPLIILGAAGGMALGWFVGDAVAPEMKSWFALIFGASTGLHLWPNRQSVNAHRIGAVGEVRVGRELGKLAEGFYAFHDVKIPGRRANIDHLVIGPTGAFTIETKAVSGKVELRSDEVWLSGRKKNYVTQAWEQAGSVQTVLSDLVSAYAIDVKPLLCFTKAELPLLQDEVAGIPLLGPRGVRRHISKRDQLLNKEQVDKLRGAAIERLRILAPHS